MLEVLKQVWKTNKIRVILVAIPVILLMLAAVFLGVKKEYILYVASKLLGATKEEDKKLSEEAAKANAAAEEHKKTANELGDKADDIKPDPDWNKGFK